jgi:hypothetical protein
VAGNFNRFIRTGLNVKPATSSRNHREIRRPRPRANRNRERERAGVSDAKEIEQGWTGFTGLRISILPILSIPVNYFSSIALTRSLTLAVLSGSACVIGRRKLPTAIVLWRTDAEN